MCIYSFLTVWEIDSLWSLGVYWVFFPSLSGGVFGQWNIPLQHHRQSQIQGKEIRLRKSPQGGTTLPQSGPATQGNRSIDSSSWSNVSTFSLFYIHILLWSLAFKLDRSYCFIVLLSLHFPVITLYFLFQSGKFLWLSSKFINVIVWFRRAVI